MRNRYYLKTFLAFVSFFLFSSYVLPPTSFVYAAAAPTIKQVCIKDQCLSVEIADTNIQRARGLQDRKELPDDSGMLFVFETPDVYDFWMKDTLIALDMIWIDQNKKVVDIKADVPPCAADPCAIYTPSGEAKYVLEIKAGQSQALKLNVGDELVFK